jgi:hypothetical protein
MAAWAWYRYGVPRQPRAEESDPLLDRFMPVYEVVERHHIRVAAPADITLAAAGEMELESSSVIAAIFKARELVLGGTRDTRVRPRGLLAQVQSYGWGVLAAVPGREVVVGAVTQPWKANVEFRAVAPEAFASFDEPGNVKIAWTLRADPLSDGSSVFRTETRAVTTDAAARRLFRRYWSLASPGIALIRRLSLGPLKADAERRAIRLRA